MAKNALVLVHSAPEVHEAANKSRHRSTSAGAPNAYDYAYRENVLRKEVGKHAMERLHHVLSNEEKFSSLRADVALAYIREGLDRAYGRSMTPVREPMNLDDQRDSVNGGTLRDTLLKIAESGNLPELMKAKRASETSND